MAGVGLCGPAHTNGKRALFILILRSATRCRACPTSALEVSKSAIADLDGRVSKDDHYDRSVRPSFEMDARKSGLPDLRMMAPISGKPRDRARPPQDEVSREFPGPAES